MPSPPPWGERHHQPTTPPDAPPPPRRRGRVLCCGDDMSATERTLGWAARRADGQVIADFEPDITEAKIWEIALGWPRPEEIQWHKAHGGMAFRCELKEVEDV